MTFDSFVKRFIGKAVDYDGVSGVQCVDLVKLYLYNVFGIRAGAWGNARDYWLDFNSHKIMKENFTKIKNTPEFVPQKGDILVWNGDISIKNNYGHIAIATGEGDTHTFYSYDSNWNKKEMQKVKHTYFALYGVLRPKNIKVLFAAPDVSLGDYSLTNVRGIYNFAGAKSGRKKVKEITRNAKKSATSQKADNNAYLKAGTAVSVLETKLISTGNLCSKMILSQGASCSISLSIFSLKSNTTAIEIINAMANTYVPKNFLMIYQSSRFINRLLFILYNLVDTLFTIIGFQVEKSPAMICFRASPTSHR